MQRQSRKGRAIAWMAVVALCSSARAQQPVGGNVEPRGLSPEPSAAVPLDGSVVPESFGGQPPADGAIAPRTDVYSNYSDAYMNPETAAPYGAAGIGGNSAAGAVDEAIRGPKYWRLYGGAEALYYHRSRPGNKILLRTTPNLFDDNPQQLVAPNANVCDNVFGIIADGPREGLPNDPNNPNSRVNVDEFLVPNEVRFQTTDFDNPSTPGYRYTIGIELESGNKVEFNFSYVQDIESRHIDDVSGAAFLTFQITDPASPTNTLVSRFGYLNAPFILPVNNARLDGLPDPFSGEWRIQLGTPNTPHDPVNESPPVRSIIIDGQVVNDPFLAGVTLVSNDVPREPTNTDVVQLSASNPRYLFSLLWTDGELAVIDYNFDMQNAELVYKRRIFEYELTDWRLDLLSGIRYIGLDEQFNFYFADVAGGGPNSPVQPRDPFDRFAANNPGLAQGNITQPRAQRSDEASATYIAGIENDLVGPEIGLNAKYQFLYFFELDMTSKASFAANFLRNRQAIIRGDGLELYDYEKNVQSTSGIIEGRLGLRAQLLPNLALRGGWEYMWLINVGSAINQIEFDLTRRPRPSNEEKLLWHGWYGGFELTY